MKKEKTKNPLLSTIIPIYKVEKYLDRCLESVTNQTYKNLEIILVDDGSPDNCPKMCDDWAKKDKRIRVFHKQNGGVSSARNLGIEKSTGDYITFVDSDDTIELETYEKSIKKMKKDVDTVFFKMKLFYPEKTIENDEYNLKLLEENKDNICPFYYKKQNKHTSGNANIMGSCWRVLFNSKVIKENNFAFNQNLYYQEDKEFLLRYLLYCKKVSVVDEYLYNYYLYETSASRNIKTYLKLAPNLNALFFEESKTILANPTLTKKEKKKIIKSAATDYCVFTIIRYLSAGATKQEIKDLYKNETFKNLLKNGGLFILKNPYISLKRSLVFMLTKFKMTCIIKKLINKFLK